MSELNWVSFAAVPATTGTASRPTATDTVTPPTGTLHEVPIAAVEMLEACWTRCRMAGMGRSRYERSVRWVGLATTLLSALTGVAAFTALQDNTDVASMAIVGVVTATAAVIAALQAWVNKQQQDGSKRMGEVGDVFHGLHIELMDAVSRCQLHGTFGPDDLLQRAAAARAAHVKSMGEERPSFTKAKRSVETDLRGLGLIR